MDENPCCGVLSTVDIFVCLFQMKKEHLDDHLKDAMSVHLQLIVQAITNNESKVRKSPSRNPKPPAFDDIEDDDGYRSGKFHALTKGYAGLTSLSSGADVERDGLGGSSKRPANLLEKESASQAEQDMEDRDFRISLIENSNYDGTMIWKIPQFAQRQSDAKTGKYTSVFSLPFYTCRYGYKMCLRLYICGDGIGKGSHMSLFFVVMKGEFDNILKWPFMHRVTFRLINQKGHQDVIDTFQPDPTSSSFKKPKADMNIASGCPRFVLQKELKDNGFVVDDTIFIKCEVDTKTILHP